MRIALNAIGEVGVRTGRILTAERDLVALGIYGEGASLGQDRRIIRIQSLDAFEVLVTDDVDGGSAIAALAADDGLSCVLPGEATADVADRFERSGSSVLVVDCSLRGLAATLATHEAARIDAVLDTIVAWTEPGKPMRKGEPVAFPEPVGARWGELVESHPHLSRIRVPVDGDWSGAATTVRGEMAGRTEKRIIGVADETAHLEAIALAAGAVMATQTDLTGVIRPEDESELYLAAALQMGLGVATYTLD